MIRPHHSGLRIHQCQGAVMKLLRWFILCAVPVAVHAAQSTPQPTPSPLPQRVPGPADCTALAGLAAPGYQVDTAEWIAAGSLPAGPPGNTVQVPAHCLFRITL